MSILSQEFLSYGGPTWMQTLHFQYERLRTSRNVFEPGFPLFKYYILRNVVVWLLGYCLSDSHSHLNTSEETLQNGHYSLMENCIDSSEDMLGDMGC
jgi:hypothetical protein